MFKFEKPKFMKGSTVKTPNGEGRIMIVTFDQGIHWYGVEGKTKVPKFYAESELIKLN